jgi:hypothetical protein
MNASANSLEARMAEILENHFQNYENPHETILQMWSLLNLHGLSTLHYNQSGPDEALVAKSR